MTEQQGLSEHDQLWVARLRARFPDQTAGISDGELARRVRGLLPLCMPLRIEDEREQLRFVALMAVLLTPEQRKSPLIQGVVQRILGAEDWDADKRLDFLFEHVVGRPVSPDEPDLGPSFVPKAPGA